MRLARRAINILKEEGIVVLLYKSISLVERKANILYQMVILLIFNLFSRPKLEDNTYTIVLRESNIDSDTISIISELSKKKHSYGPFDL